MIDKETIELIKKHEGFEPRVYECTAGYDTIGYGFAIKDLHLSESISTAILTEIVARLEIQLIEKFEWYTSAPKEVKAVVIDMCYNLGVTGFSKFRKTIYYLETEQYEEASVELLDSLYAKQVPNRANENSEILSNIKEENKNANPN